MGHGTHNAALWEGGKMGKALFGWGRPSLMAWLGGVSPHQASSTVVLQKRLYAWSNVVCRKQIKPNSEAFDAGSRKDCSCRALYSSACL